MIEIVNTRIAAHKPIDASDALTLEIEYDTLISCYSQLFVRTLKAEIRRIPHWKWNEVLDRALRRNESLLSIAKEFRLGTFKFAKMFMEKAGYGNITVSSLVANPLQIEDPRIRMELLAMIDMDPVCSPEIEKVKECMGREYEQLLIGLLEDKKMCFETEEQLRSRGKPKTPDVLFLIPMAMAVGSSINTHLENDVFTAEGGATYDDSEHRQEVGGSPMKATGLCYDGEDDESDDVDKLFELDLKQTRKPLSQRAIRSNQLSSVEANSNKEYVIINWIDSKALFADAVTFRENLEQFRAYTNRYGRGLVIYWHGFTEDILTAELSSADGLIVVRDSFPSDWIFPTGEPADGRTPAFDKIQLPA